MLHFSPLLRWRKIPTSLYSQWEGQIETINKSFSNIKKAIEVLNDNYNLLDCTQRIWVKVSE